MMEGERPNVVLVVADQMSYRAMPFHGNNVVRAPSMEWLASEGVVFDAMYCNYPLCAPSRVAMLTGQLASKLGVYDNGAEFPASELTLAHVFRGAGYLTCLSGKMHFIGPDQLHGYEERLTTDIYPSDFGWTADWTRASPGTGEMRVVMEAGRCKRSVQLDFDDDVSFRAQRWLFSHARRRPGTPFFLTVSFSHPHDPFSMSDEYWNRYRESEVDMPSIPRAEDPHSRKLREHFGMDVEQPRHAHVRNARHAYYAAISYIDDRVGDLLRTLETCGMLDHTIVILTSDHGEFLGERDLWFKRSFYEESVRVPFIVYAPGRVKCGRVAAPCSLADLMPTLAELVQTEASGTRSLMDDQIGESLWPHLEGSGAQHLPVFAEVMAEGTPAPLFMVRQGRYKYIQCALYPSQLFDLERDNLEQRNLLDEGAETNRQMARVLATLVEENWSISQLTQDVAASQQRRKLIAASLAMGQVAPWDFEPPSSAGTSYYRNSLAFEPLRLFDRACLANVVVCVDGGFRCGSYSLGSTREEAVASIAADLDLANAINRSLQEATTFLR